MPTYEYSCTRCRFEFEEFQSIAAEPISVCPKCGAAVQRKISGGSGLIFKGSGFYITDYKKRTSTAESDSSSAKGKSSGQDSTKPKKKDSTT